MINTGRERSVHEQHVLQSYLQPDRLKLLSWSEMDGCSRARRSWEQGRPAGSDEPCLGGPVDATVLDSVAPLGLLWRKPKVQQAAQYILALCELVWVFSLHWLHCCLFLSKHQEEVRVGKGWRQIMISLYRVYFYINIYLEQGAISSAPFHFTN